MKKYYLLFGMLLLMQIRGITQSSDVFAAVYKPASALKQNKESNPLKHALTEVERFFQVSIAYKDEWIENKQVDFSSGSYKGPEQALDSLLKDTGLYYEKAGDRFYVIYKKQTRVSGSPQSSSIAIPALMVNASQDFASAPVRYVVPYVIVDLPVATISGTVTDENGQSFPGVNIVVKGTSTGTTTDTNGKFSLNVDETNAVLVISFVGYETQEVSLAGRTQVDIVMQPDVQSLDEVVVTALGIERTAKSLGYSTTKVKSDELTVNRTPNMMNALQGKVAGVNISSMGTGPGGTSKVRIRGQSSITGQNNPLIVVNGTPIDNTNFGNNIGNSGDDSSMEREPVLMGEMDFPALTPTI